MTRIYCDAYARAGHDHGLTEITTGTGRHVTALPHASYVRKQHPPASGDTARLFGQRALTAGSGGRTVVVDGRNHHVHAKLSGRGAPGLIARGPPRQGAPAGIPSADGDGSSHRGDHPVDTTTWSRIRDPISGC